MLENPALKALLLMFLCLMLTPAAAVEPRDPYQYFFEQSLGDMSEELEVAREEGKKGVFVFFELDECPFCHRMKRTVLNRPEVQDYYRRHFHNLAVDIEGDIEVTDFHGEETTLKGFAKQYRVRATPVLAFFDLDGNLLVRYTGATSGAEEFMWLADYYLQGVYNLKDKNGRRISFTRYKRMRKKEKASRS
jgi:thioredoxin-related protein